MRAHEFITEAFSKQDELSMICSLNCNMKSKGISPTMWMDLLEQHHLTGKLLSESADVDVVNTVERLNQNYGGTLVIGEKYIPVPCMVLNNELKVMDTYGEFPATKPARFLTLIAINANERFLTFRDHDNNEYEFPNKNLRKLLYTQTIATPSLDAYNKLSMMLKLTYTISLPAIESSDIDEDISRRGFLQGTGAAALGAGAVQTAHTPQLTQQQKQLPIPVTPPAPTPPIPHNEAVLLKQATAAGIKGMELKQLLAQGMHETLNWLQLKEVPPEKYRDPALTAKYFEKKYGVGTRAGKIIGNTVKGDGAKYKGRGHLMITGKYNYGIVGKGIGQDLVTHPELLENPEIGAQASLWWWTHKVKPKVSDFTDVTQATKKINPTLKGLKSRMSKFKDYVSGKKS
jgi:predicted chitinase